MKKWISLAIMLCFCLLISGCELLNQSLIGQNMDKKFYHASLNPTFSHQGGFYNHSIDLVITPKENTIVHVTLDSSTPNESSPIYERIIHLEESYIDKETEEKIVDQFNDFSGPISFIKTTPSKWVSPKSDVFKAHVVKVIAYDQLGLKSEVITQTYFIAHDIFNKYTLPLLSISTDSYHLYDFNEGIQIPGVHYDEDIIKNNRTGNYFEKGETWEKPAYIEYYNQQGILLLAQNAGLSIHGGLSRMYPLKSYRLSARSMYDQSSSFNYPIFEDLDKDQFKRLILRNFGQAYEYTVFGEAAAHEVIKPLGLDMQHSTPVILFLNGEYFGIRNIRERIDQHYIYEKYQIKPEEMTILSGHAYHVEGSALGSLQYLSTYRYITTHDMNKKEHYRYAKTHIDIQNLIDYYILQLYFANIDWPQNNILYWKKNVNYNPNAPDGHDGRWRFMVYDLDAGFAASWGGNRPDINSFERLDGSSWKTGKLFVSLLDNDEFKAQFIYRLMHLSETVFHKDVTMEIINHMKSIYEVEMEEHINRWGYPHSMSTWNYYVDKMIHFAEHRNTYFLEHMYDYFGFDTDEVSFKVDFDSTKGYLEINEKIYNHQTFYGLAYKDIPSTIEAFPKDGYYFKHFENQDGIILSKEQTYVFYPDETMDIIAIFETGNRPFLLEISHDIIWFSMMFLVGIGFIGIDHLFKFYRDKKMNKSIIFLM